MPTRGRGGGIGGGGFDKSTTTFVAPANKKKHDVTLLIAITIV